MRTFAFGDFLDDLFDQIELLLFTWQRSRVLLYLCLELLKLRITRTFEIAQPPIHSGEALQVLQPLVSPSQIFFSFFFCSPLWLIVFFIDSAERALSVIKLTISDLILPHKTIQLIQFDAYRHRLACYLPYLWRPMLWGDFG